DCKSRLIVVGMSAGGMKLLVTLLQALPADFTIPIVCVMHLSEDTGDSWVNLMNNKTPLTVKEAEEKETIQNGTIYLAPPGYHLLIEGDRSFTLTYDERVNYARPSIDVTFETAAYSLGNQVIGFLGTGGNSDGAKGLLRIKERGGYTMVQQPSFAEFPAMPESALQLFEPNKIVTVEGLINQLLAFDEQYKLVHES
ncbi:MAG: chemotaxis protein CheB, partial [Ekhidna sp.]